MRPNSYRVAPDTRRRNFKSRKNKGVSEVVGALLLILVVVIAVGSFAAFLSYTQTTAQNRQNYINSVQDENLQISSVSPSPSIENAQYELVNGTCPKCYVADYIQINTTSPDSVYLISTGGSYSLPNGTYSLQIAPQGGSFSNAEYNVIPTGTYANATTGTPGTLHILQTQPASGEYYKIGVFTWGSLTINVRNLNTQNSEISAISVNGVYITPFLSNGLEYNTSAPLFVPAKSSVQVLLLLTNLSIPATDPLSFLLLSTVGNFFSATFTPPVTQVTQTTQVESSPYLTVDVPSFDGTSTNASNYLWEVLVPNSNWNYNEGWSSSSVSVAFVQGPIFQYRPNALFSYSSYTTTPELNITGPIEVMLISTASDGQMSVSQPIQLPPDPNIAPAGSFSAVPNSTSIIVTVYDLFHRPLPGVTVTLLPQSGDVNLSSYTGLTGANGEFQTQIFSGSGVVEVVSGDLQPQFITVP